jgi:hypothetical protein
MAEAENHPPAPQTPGKRLPGRPWGSLFAHFEKRPFILQNLCYNSQKIGN